MKVKKQHRALIPFIGSCILTIGILLGYGMKDVRSSADSQVVKSGSVGQNIEDVMGLINKNFIDNKDISLLEDELIHDLVGELDPYSQYISPNSVEKYDLRTNGEYVGLGIETLDIGEDVVISKVIANGPAHNAGVLKGTKIISVNSKKLDSSNWHSDSLSIFLSQNTDSILHFELDHFGSEKSNKVSVTKGTVKLNNISSAVKLGETTGYIGIDKFGNGVYRDFMQNLESLTTDTLQNLIIDLRNNPGGFVDETCKIISQFLPERVEFLHSVNRAGELTPYNSNGQSFFDIRNVVVLINENSASASEIMAGALQDMDRAIIVGSPSFGKGMIQEQFRLRNGGVLKLSVSRYQLPSGRTIGGIAEKGDQIFKTKKKKREVNNTGKIDPDYIIAEDITSYGLFMEAYKSLKVARRDELLMDEESKKEWLASIPNSYSSPYGDMIKHEVLTILSTEDNASPEYLKVDLSVSKALELFADKDEWGILK